jgi:hypothetical protein
MPRRRQQYHQVEQKRYNKTILYENKTWHVVYEHDGLSFAVQEVKKGIVGGRVMPFASKGLESSLQQEGLVTQRTDVIFI